LLLNIIIIRLLLKITFYPKRPLYSPNRARGSADIPDPPLSPLLDLPIERRFSALKTLKLRLRCGGRFYRMRDKQLFHMISRPK